MRFIFFQNCISPHQMPYIEALSRRGEVGGIRVIAPRLTYNDRAAMGWSKEESKDMPNLRIAIRPADGDVMRWLQEDIAADRVNGENPVCLFSGINAFPEVFHWLRMTLGLDVSRGDITEAPYLFEHPLWMHRLRFLLKDLKYVRYFSWVFAIGEDCKTYYEGWSHRWKVVPFMYCTKRLSSALRADVENYLSTAEPDPSVCRIAFVGSVDERKNVITVLEALKLIATGHPDAFARCQVTLVGDGPLREELEQKSRDEGLAGNIHFAGTRAMDETQRILAAQDILILPSLHDGWGAVVNEALTLGVWPMVSDKCGARQVITEGRNGNVFPVSDAAALSKLLLNAIGNICQIRATRRERMSWAETHISPEAVADIMLQTVKS